MVRRTISLTNEHVINTLNNASNASELISVAILYYLDMLDKNYIETYKLLQDANNTLKRSVNYEDGKHYQKTK